MESVGKVEAPDYKIYLPADTIGWEILALYRALSYHIFMFLSI
jgi:hypothetical protein